MKTSFFALLMMIAALLLGGCSGDNDIEGVQDTLQSAELSLIPDEDELAARLGLSDSQRTAFAALIADWRDGMKPGGKPQNGETHGKRGERMMTFLSGAAEILDRDQLKELLVTLGEHREAMMASGRRGGDSRRGPGGEGHGARPDISMADRLENLNSRAQQRLEFLTTFLQLSDEQSAALTELSDTGTAQIRAIFEELGDSAQPAEIREQVREIHEAMDEALRALLDDPQVELLDLLQDLMDGGRTH